ncbi:MAG: hypothetical protein LBF54_02565 [Holosporaceae bacterium]|jgi:prefoldin subunit 5|nr:hypothetical protein [Holosporaceae bacterium]
MRKIITYEMIAVGFFVFSGVSEESAAFLKIGRSSTMTSDMGAAYGLGVKSSLNEAITRVEKRINFLKKIAESLKDLNAKCYEFVDKETLTKIDAKIKDLISLKEVLELIRDSKREKIEKLKPVIVDLNVVHETLEKVLEEADMVLAAMGEKENSEHKGPYGTEGEDYEASRNDAPPSQVNDNKIKDKDVKKAMKAYKEAQEKMKSSTEGFCSKIRKFISSVKDIEYRTIPILKLKITRKEVEGNKSIEAVEETMKNLFDLNQQTKDFCEKMGAEFKES